jgi:hypothetical protein
MFEYIVDSAVFVDSVTRFVHQFVSVVNKLESIPPVHVQSRVPACQ